MRKYLYWFILVVILAVLYVAYSEDQKQGGGGTLRVLALTAGLLAWYACETYRLRKSTEESNTFSALARIHEGLSNDLSYRLRGLLHSTAYCDQLTKAMSEVEVLKSCVQDGRVSAAAIAKLLDGKWAREDEALRRFNEQLDKVSIDLKPGQDNSALSVVERVLLSLDAIALPATLKINSAQEATKAYKPIFEKTARHILPFVAIQMRLRGDRLYKWHYLRVLDQLAIVESLKSVDGGTADLLHKLLVISRETRPKGKL
jgi:hypothetical protein